jgi:hypothetical protein
MSQERKDPVSVEWVAAKSFVSLMAAFFLALSVWGHVSGIRGIVTTLEARLPILQDQLTTLQEQLDIFTTALPVDRQGGPDSHAITMLREQLEMNKRRLAETHKTSP